MLHNIIKNIIRKEYIMSEKYCYECGSKLIKKELENEGIISFCLKCNQYHFPMYNVAVSMIVINKETNKLLLIKQYGKPFYILVAGYVNRTEQLEHAVARECALFKVGNYFWAQDLKVVSFSAQERMEQQ